MRLEHPFEPVFDSRSRVLILGSFPSVRSRAEGFYYGHPQNRFWRVLAELFDEPVAITNERRRDQLLRHHIALWDVIASCDIKGSSDASITNAVPNDLSRILDSADIRGIFVNGKTAEKYYIKYSENMARRKAVCLPSTSPANAAWSMEKLVEAWSEVTK